VEQSYCEINAEVVLMLSLFPAGAGTVVSCSVAELLSESPASPGELLSCSVAKLLSESPKDSPSSTTQQPNNLTTPRVSAATQQPNNSTTASGAANIMYVALPVSGYRQSAGSLSMDERKFLPQVLRVIEKAYGPGGALAVLPAWKNAALATQYQQASWMAFCRGNRGMAMKYWLTAVRYNVMGPRRIHKPWIRLAYRYVMGRASAGNE
jgi:hypothetical protein